MKNYVAGSKIFSDFKGDRDVTRYTNTKKQNNSDKLNLRKSKIRTYDYPVEKL